MVPNKIPLFGGLTFTLYGLFIAIGILSCFLILYFYTAKKKVPQSVQDFIFFIAIFSIAIGFVSAKFFQSIYDWIERGYYDFNSAGITAMGGFVGGIVFFILLYFGVGRFYFRGDKKGFEKKYFNDVILVAPICISSAHAFGRLGCLMAGCCHGSYLGTEYVFGGIWMKGTTYGWGYYVPTQLYESLFLFALTAVLTILYFKRCNIIAPIYLIAYGVWRIFIEFFRDDHVGEFLPWLSPSQWQSIIFILVGVAILVFYLIKKIPFILPKTDEAEKTKQ